MRLHRGFRHALAWVVLAGCADPPADDGDDGGPTVEVIHARRLTRVELRQSLRDLLGTQLDFTLPVPVDGQAKGFDNVESVLTLSSLHVAAYADVARRASVFAFGPLSLQDTYLAGDGRLDRVAGPGGAGAGEGIRFTTKLAVPADGRYAVTLEVRALDQTDEELSVFLGPNVRVYALQGTVREVLEVSLESARLHDLTVEAPVPFAWVRMDIQGPLDGEDVPERADLLPCDPSADGTEACARTVLAPLVRRAWRGTPDDATMDELVAYVTEAVSRGGSFEEGLSAALERVLLSPRFLFLTERALGPEGGALRIDGVTLASRLAAFLWRSVPDEALLDDVQAGLLEDPAVVADHVRRMLADPRGATFTERLADQWLSVEGLTAAAPSPILFPEFDEALRQGMRDEVYAFVQALVSSDRPMSELLTGTDAVLSPRLAEHYEVVADEEGRVDLTGTGRSGVLGQASLHTVFSAAHRTSPVRRGAWILENLLCDTVEAPPPGVAGLIDQGEPEGTLRDRLEAHRANPFCASCHQRIDPLGLALEHFDPVGRWRTEEPGGLVDASSALPDGTTFNGADELSTLLADDPRFHRCVVDKLFLYALGRGAEARDEPDLAAMAKASLARETGLQGLVQSLVASDAFHAPYEVP